MDRQYYTAKDIQDIFHLSKNNAYKLMNSDGFPCMRIGKKLLVSVEELKKWQNKYKYGAFDY